jgi:CHASE3 domain sensor protein
MTDAESAQRGYLLTGESAYLNPYAAAVAKVRGALDRLHDAYGGDDSSSEFHELRILTGRELGELEDGVALSKRRGTPQAVNVIGTDVGKRTMDSIVAIIGSMRK